MLTRSSSTSPAMQDQVLGLPAHPSHLADVRGTPQLHVKTKTRMNTNLQTNPAGKKILFHLALTWRSITNHKPDRITWEDDLCGLGKWERGQRVPAQNRDRAPTTWVDLEELTHLSQKYRCTLCEHTESPSQWLPCWSQCLPLVITANSVIPVPLTSPSPQNNSPWGRLRSRQRMLTATFPPRWNVGKKKENR